MTIAEAIWIAQGAAAQARAERRQPWEMTLEEEAESLGEEERTALRGRISPSSRG